jgi:hypothetical protein
MNLFAPVDGVHTTPTVEQDMTPFSEYSRAPEIHTYPASLTFTMTHDGIEDEQDLNFALSKDVYFVTAHPCAPSSHVKFFKSPTSPTIQQINVGDHDWNGKISSAAHITGKLTQVLLYLYPIHSLY